MATPLRPFSWSVATNRLLHRLSHTVFPFFKNLRQEFTIFLNMDLFISTGELSGDLHGGKLVEELRLARPNLNLGGIVGPRMRALGVKEYFPMESLQVMGFIDVLWALPKLARQFFAIRNQILALAPKAVVCVDYSGLHLKLEQSLRKKGYRGKLIHLVCPTVWAWRKQLIPQMAQTLDLLLAFFPFEPACFAGTQLPVRYIGHPLTEPIAAFVSKGLFQGQKILGLFPGSRKTEVERNLPLQLAVARRLQEEDPELQIAVSVAHEELVPPIEGVKRVPPEQNYELMHSCRVALATSGTVTLELALHGIPTVVNFAIRPIDLFIAQKIFHIDLPFYCIANIIVQKRVFPELFGPRLTEEQLFFWARTLWFDEAARKECLAGCEEVRKSLGVKRAAKEAADAILSIVDF